MRTRVLPFLPAIFAVLTGGAVKILFELYLREHQPDYLYPMPLVFYQLGMVGVAWLLASPVRWIWMPAVFILGGGMLVAGFSVGVFYLPTVIVAAWVSVKQLEATPVEPPV